MVQKGTAFLVLSLGLHGVLGVALFSEFFRTKSAFSPVQGPVAGGTFDINAVAENEHVVLSEPEAARAAERAQRTTHVTPPHEDSATMAPRPVAVRHNATETATEREGLPGVYGAIGDRSAVDLANFFRRTFPSVASADPLWARAPIGNAGEIYVVVTLDDSGHVTDAHLDGTGSPALKQSATRTLFLVRPRIFTAKAKTTRFLVSATISTDQVHDGLHGDRIALGAQTDSDEAFFAIPIGRRIDIRVRTH